jgi:hypothetical protein
MEWIQSKIKEIDGFKNVFVFYFKNYSVIFDSIASSTPPCAYIIYEGSNWADRPRRSGKIIILLITSNAGNRDEAQEEALGLISSVIEKIDYELYNNALFRIERDFPVEIGNSLLNAYEIEIGFEDH